MKNIMIALHKHRRLVVSAMYVLLVLARLALCMAVAVVVISLTSCDPCRRCVRPAESVRTEIVHDTIIIREHYIDTNLVVRLLQELVSAASSSTDTVTAETEYSWAIAFVDGKLIRLTMGNKPTAPAGVKIVYRDTSYHKETKNIEKDKEIIRERYVPKIVSALATIGGIAIAFLLFWLVILVVRRRF